MHLVGYCCFDYTYVEMLVAKLGPLPAPWVTKWEAMKKDVPPDEILRKFTISFGRRILLTSLLATDIGYKPLVETFEPRRDTIMANMEKAEYYEVCEYTTEDYEALKCLLGTMEGLMQHEPDKRLLAEEAASRIQWVDRWRELELSNGVGSEDEEWQ